MKNPERKDTFQFKPFPNGLFSKLFTGTEEGSGSDSLREDDENFLECAAGQLVWQQRWDEVAQIIRTGIVLMARNRPEE